jgi:NAD(P)-dependent dehydrogenase (short-subunit alcohol dehydrogenase family)
MKQKVALVTGGASGLGKAIAERLAADGAHVVITDIQAALGQTVAAESGFKFLPQDVTDESRWPEVIAQVGQFHGGLHVLVNNAGVLSPPNSTLEGSGVADWDRIFAVNVRGVFLGCRAAIPAIHASGGGSIINISSIAGLVATPMALAYGASKAAVRHLTKSIAQHCLEEKLKIRCNSVHPGMVRTPALDKGVEDRARLRGLSTSAMLEKLQSAVPMGEFTEERDIAAAVAFLSSDDSRHMTGAPLVIDGGMVYCDTFHTDLSARR